MEVMLGLRYVIFGISGIRNRMTWGGYFVYFVGHVGVAWIQGIAT